MSKRCNTEHKDIYLTNIKLNYLQKLVNVGFDVIDIGSFVSHKAIPQLVDSATVIESIDLSDSNSELLVIIANKQGAINASKRQN